MYIQIMERSATLRGVDLHIIVKKYVPFFSNENKCSSI